MREKRQNLDPEKVSRLDILKEMDKSDDIRHISSLTKFGIKATKLNLEVIK